MPNDKYEYDKLDNDLIKVGGVYRVRVQGSLSNNIRLYEYKNLYEYKTNDISINLKYDDVFTITEIENNFYEDIRFCWYNIRVLIENRLFWLMGNYHNTKSVFENFFEKLI